MLAKIEAYFDAAPRFAAQVEEMPPFVLFVRKGNGWSYYARPQLGADVFTANDVSRVLERQRELAIPQAFEWVDETTPGLLPAAREAGLSVGLHPLMAAVGEPPEVSPPGGVTIRLVTPDDDLALFGAVAGIGFGAPGTSRGEAGTELLAGEAAKRAAGDTAFVRERIASGRTVMAVALHGGLPVAVGSHQPVGKVTEIVGVATLPAYRRRGIGAAVTACLRRHAEENGARLVFLSAGSEEVGRVYERVGFSRVGTACIAERSE